VRADEQLLYVWEAGRIRERFAVSTAARGVGNREGSLQTPLGLHRVAQKIGDAEPAGTVFRGRENTGEVAPVQRGSEENAPGDRVTSRILWLEGLEPGVNQGGDVDSFSRYIYIHGTDEEGRIGTPASHGCVRMRNQDVIGLFAQVPLNTLVLILDAAG
jgi:lipoprotein-anchoring transpeptidase ErfK/SrfK